MSMKAIVESLMQATEIQVSDLEDLAPDKSYEGNEDVTYWADHMPKRKYRKDYSPLN